MREEISPQVLDLVTAAVQGKDGQQLQLLNLVNLLLVLLDNLEML